MHCTRASPRLWILCVRTLFVRGVLSAKAPDSSFAEALRFSPNRPTWKMKIRRMKRKMRETVKSAKWRAEEKSEQTLRMKHGWRDADNHLEPMSRATLLNMCAKIAISCKRSCYNKLKNELHQCSFHCHHEVLDEEDEYATFGIDKEELVQVVLLQIHGGHGAYLLVLLLSLIGVSSVHFCLICSMRYTNFPIFRTPQREGGQQEWFSCANLSISMHFSTVQPIFDLRITICWISWEGIVNSFKFLFESSPPRVMGHIVLFLCLSFAVPSTMVSLLLVDVVRNWEGIQSPLIKIWAGFAFNQEVSTSAIDYSLIPIMKAFWALHFRNCFAQLEQLYIAHFMNHRFRFVTE